MAPAEIITGEEFIGLAKIFLSLLITTHGITNDTGITEKDNPRAVGILVPCVFHGLVIVVKGFLVTAHAAPDFTQIIIGTSNIQGIPPLDALGHHESGN